MRRSRARCWSGSTLHHRMAPHRCAPRAPGVSPHPTTVTRPTRRPTRDAAAGAMAPSHPRPRPRSARPLHHRPRHTPQQHSPSPVGRPAQRRHAPDHARWQHHHHCLWKLYCVRLDLPNRVGAGGLLCCDHRCCCWLLHATTVVVQQAAPYSRRGWCPSSPMRGSGWATWPISTRSSSTASSTPTLRGASASQTTCAIPPPSARRGTCSTQPPSGRPW